MNKEYLKNLREFSKNIKILYVEDNKEARASTMELLKMFFKDIVVAFDGKDGLDKFSHTDNQDIQLVVTDINMPNMDGLEMIAKIKEINKDISIMVISAYNEIDYLMESIKIQVDSYILKPINTTIFIPTISKVLKKLKLEIENKEYKNNLEKLVKQQVQEIEEQNKIIFQQSKLAAMGEMIDSIAHQWKQPLGTISLHLQSLQIKNSLNDKINPEDIEQCTTSINLQIKHLISTIDEFRGFFRPDAKVENVCIKEIVDSVMLLLKDEIIKSKININIDGDFNLTAKMISNEFKHILINLLNNAKDAFNNTKKSKNININIKKEETFAVLQISDNAGGIPEDIIQNIFKANFTTKKSSGGTGMGLYMSKLITEKIHGILSVENISDGAMFSIKIPI